MANELFKEGGPHNIRKTGPTQYNMTVSLPTDEDGRTARECPKEECSPGYFKVKNGTGITGGQEFAYCPYCRNQAVPNDFFTKEQLRYAKDILQQEAFKAVENRFANALGLDRAGKKKIGGGFLSIEMSLNPSSKPIIRRPFEKEVRRDVICPHCGLYHSVYGLATWCADCGQDIFLTHVEAELSVVRAMLGDVERRRELLGSRVAAKDLENCLEDTVSIFEAVLKVLVKRYQRQAGVAEEEVDGFFKKIGNAFQSVERTQEIFLTKVGILLFPECSSDEIHKLACIFEKRHPITHNLGVIDKKYIDKSRTTEEEGKEVSVSAIDIEDALILSMETFSSLHNRMCGKAVNEHIDSSS